MDQLGALIAIVFALVGRDNVSPLFNRRFEMETVRIWITKPMDDAPLGRFLVCQFRLGGVYDVGCSLATLLIVSGYALPEMRSRGDAQGNVD
jgi:hypothetical protein